MKIKKMKINELLENKSIEELDVIDVSALNESVSVPLEDIETTTATAVETTDTPSAAAVEYLPLTGGTLAGNLNVLGALLVKAIEIANEVHKEQTDKGGTNYIEHPMRVSRDCKTIDAKIVAILHDTIEDGDITPHYLLDIGFSQDIVDAIISVTKKQKENYVDFILRAKNNPIGREVKIWAIIDNMDLSRLKRVTSKDITRLTKYREALKVLIS